MIGLRGPRVRRACAALVWVTALTFPAFAQQPTGAELQAQIETLRRALETDPNDLQARFSLGNALLAGGQIDAAIVELTAVRDATGDPGVQFVLGQAFLDAKRYDEADVALTAAALARADHPPLLFLRAEVCFETGNLAAAERYFARAVEIQPGWAMASARRGMVALDDNRPRDAAERLREAAELAPGSADIRMLLATALNRSERPDEAIESLRAAVAAEPTALAAYLTLAERYDRLDRRDELAQLAAEILRRWPGEPTALLHTAQRHSLDGETESALGAVETALRTLGQRPLTRPGIGPEEQWSSGQELLRQARQLRAELLARSDREDEALSEAEALMRDFPGEPEGYFLAGNILRRQREVDRAAQLLTEFQALSRARGHRRQGLYYLEIGDLARARPEVEAALANDPDDAASAIGLARIERREGRPERAAELLERARGVRADPQAWYSEWLPTLRALERTAELADAWQASRALGLQLNPEAWAAIHPVPAGCR